jgi:rRNA maturation protein Rpf1
LARELARVLPDAEYMPRGVKSVRKLSSLASSRGHKKIMIINSVAGQPMVLRFLDISEGWKWMNVQIELSKVELQKDLGQKIRLLDAKIVATSPKAKEFAGLLEKLWGVKMIKKAPDTGAFIIIDKDKIEFRASLAAKIGPALYVSRVVGEHGESKKS